MRVSGSAPATSPLDRPATRAPEEGFAVDAGRETASAASAVRAGPAGSLGSIEVLLALQESASPLDRRRRAVRRAGRILDALDELKLAVLDAAGLDGAALHRLAGAVRDARDTVEDPGLAGVLEEIETRAAVELAKREFRRAA